jgi:hypothetical protein
MNSDSEVNGYIGHYGLAKWWLDTFTDDEKKYIVNRYRKYYPRSGPDSLLKGDPYIPKSSTRPSTASQYLNFLTSIFRKSVKCYQIEIIGVKCSKLDDRHLITPRS